MSTDPLPTFVCPRCGRSSPHPDDIRYGYCGACHAFTGDQVRIVPESTKFCIRLNGGPYPGTRVFDDRTRTWPPPERLDGPFGSYVRTGCSEMGPTDPIHDHVIRGAEYEWEPDL